jgi:ABC-type Fe3+/spermidine/putrescine transport system ATPase subunit
VTPYLRIERLTKKFGAFTALADISLEIHEGEFVCFLGPSGCGKTTLLRAIAGLDIQTSGRIEQAGRDISALPPSKRDFGIVFQSYALFPNLTAAANVAYGLENARATKVQVAARVRELLDMIGMETRGTSTRRSSRAGSSSASPSPAPSRPRPASCSWTSRSPRSTRRCACTSATRSRSSSGASG